MTRSRSCVVRGSPRAVLANEPATMNGIPAASRSCVTRSRRPLTSLPITAGSRLSNGSSKLGSPEAIEDRLSSLRFGELRVTAQLTFDGDTPGVFAHLRGDPDPLRRAEAPKDRELHRAGLLVSVAPEHKPESTRSVLLRHRPRRRERLSASHDRPCDREGVLLTLSGAAARPPQRSIGGPLAGLHLETTTARSIAPARRATASSSENRLARCTSASYAFP
jgi:hypothetical protein